jgi:hypothetical protein
VYCLAASTNLTVCLFVQALKKRNEEIERERQGLSETKAGLKDDIITDAIKHVEVRVHESLNCLDSSLACARVADASYSRGLVASGSRGQARA